MKKIKFCLIMTTLFLFGLSANVNATLFKANDPDIYGEWSADFSGYSYANDPEDMRWSGYFVGEFSEPTMANMISAAENYLGSEVTYEWYYSKLDENGDYDGGNFLTYESTVSKDDDEGIAGTWEVIGDYDVIFYSVKAGGRDAGSTALLYYLAAPSNSGFWSTAHFGLNPQDQFFEISHLAALSEKGTPVPEPGMVILLGIGLIGLAFYSRRRLLSE